MRSSEGQSLLFWRQDSSLPCHGHSPTPGSAPAPPQTCRGLGFDFHLLLTEGILMCSPVQENSAPS